MTEAQVFLWLWIVGTTLSLVAAGIKAWKPESAVGRVIDAIAHALPSSNPKGVVTEVRALKAPASTSDDEVKP